MELLDIVVKIDLPRLDIKHIHRVLLRDDKGHALSYAFWLDNMFEEYSVPVQVGSLQVTKDVIDTEQCRTIYFYEICKQPFAMTEMLLLKKMLSWKL